MNSIENSLGGKHTAKKALDSLRQPLLEERSGTASTVASTVIDPDHSQPSEEEEQVMLVEVASSDDATSVTKAANTQQPEDEDGGDDNAAVPLYPLTRRNGSAGGSKLTLWGRHKLSLSRAPSTFWCFTWLIPLLSLVAHYSFYYGQTAPMWRLHLSQQVDLWANATNFESRAAMHTLGLPNENYLGMHDEKAVKTFTFWYAIDHLWKGKHMPGKVLPRTAAVMLVIFSGVWPHLKLLLLNTTWLFSIHHKRRTRVLAWLSTLGKWSLADVLVVCVMVGVLHLDWTVDPEAIRSGLIEHLPFCLRVVKSLYSSSDICTMLLKDVDCHVKHESWKKWGECKACVGLVKSALEHPETARDSFRGTLEGIQMSGDGQVSLRVLGMNGIYAFCFAVIMSILISLLVDILDVRAHKYNARRRRESAALRQHRPFLLPNGNESAQENGEVDDEDDDDDEDGSYGVGSPSLASDDSDSEMEQGDRRLSSDEAFHELVRSVSQTVNPVTVVGHFVSLVLCVATVYAVCSGILVESLERTVHGAIPEALYQVLGVVWDRAYSFLTLVQTTGEAGGMDYMLMATFGLFVVVGPATRAALCLLAWVIPAGRPRRKVLAAIELVGAFCAWEVLAIAAGMVDMLMPAITSTIVMKDECAAISEDGTCLKVNFDIHKSFLWVVVGGTLLVGISNLLFGISRRPPAMQRVSSITRDTSATLTMTTPSVGNRR